MRRARRSKTEQAGSGNGVAEPKRRGRKPKPAGVKAQEALVKVCDVLKDYDDAIADKVLAAVTSLRAIGRPSSQILG